LGQADIDKLLKAAALLAELDYVALLGSDTGKLVAAVASPGWRRASRPGASSGLQQKCWAAEEGEARGTQARDRHRLRPPLLPPDRVLLLLRHRQEDNIN